jgi:hypothetical protein
MGTANNGRDCSCRAYIRSVDMATVGIEENINRQIADKLFVYNYDLKQRKGDHFLERLGLFVLGCWWAYVGIGIIRFLLTRHIINV